MNYLNTATGSFVAESEDTIVWDEEIRGWMVNGINYSDFEGNVYVSSTTKGTVPPPPVPVVTPRQARLALAMTPATNNQFPHLLAQIEASFNELPEPNKTIASITWEYSTFVEKTNPLITQMQSMLGLTDEQLDSLFVQASTL